jgi:hypothetical protein
VSTRNFLLRSRSDFDYSDRLLEHDAVAAFRTVYWSNRPKALAI